MTKPVQKGLNPTGHFRSLVKMKPDAPKPAPKNVAPAPSVTEVPVVKPTEPSWPMPDLSTKLDADSTG